jgi:hypothetical protein
LSGKELLNKINDLTKSLEKLDNLEVINKMDDILAFIYENKAIILRAKTFELQEFRNSLAKRQGLKGKTNVR